MGRGRVEVALRVRRLGQALAETAAVVGWEQKTDGMADLDLSKLGCGETGGRQRRGPREKYCAGGRRTCNSYDSTSRSRLHDNATGEAYSGCPIHTRDWGVQEDQALTGSSA